MFCLSIALNYELITAIHLTTIFTMYIINLAFGLLLHLKLRKEDSAFRFWVDHNPRPYHLFRFLMISFNFKSLRLFYCRFLQKPWLSAPFDNKYMTAVRPLFIASVVNFLL